MFLCARSHLLLLPHFPRFFVLRSCLQIPQRLTLADVLFLRRATKSRLGRIPLQSWVEETAESTVEGRMRHNYQAEWSVHWERAAGPLQGANCRAPGSQLRRGSRRAIAAAQFAPRKPRRHTAPILSRPTSSTTSAYPPAL